MVRFVATVALLLAAWVPAARADDISASARGVVRVVTIAVVDQEVVGFGHGSGFAVAPNRIVTNAHVVELAARYPDNVVIGVVPSEGAKSYQGRVIAYDAHRDLALIEFTGQRLPPLTLYTGPVADGGGLVSLGYPGNVDVATARSAADYITPMAPIRSEGVFSGRRGLSGTDVLLHTASIARGNSGGPLLDRCGRVVGVNSAITRGEEGDASFAFAIADSELARFLAAANQPYAAIGLPCTSIEDRLTRDQAATAQAGEQAAQVQREAATKAQFQQQQAQAQARGDAEHARENVMALAAVMLVLGALALGGTGLLYGRDRRRTALWTGALGAVLVVGAALVFVNRPSGEPLLPKGYVASASGVGAAGPVAGALGAAAGPLVCTIAPERSRITISSPQDLGIDWGADGCVNGRTQYVETGDRWERVLVPDQEQTVSVAAFAPATRTYTDTRYLLSAAEMATVRKLRGDHRTKGCTADAAQRAAIASQQTALRSALPPLPNEKLVYDCRAGTLPASVGAARVPDATPKPKTGRLKLDLGTDGVTKEVNKLSGDTAR